MPQRTGEGRQSQVMDGLFIGNSRARRPGEVHNLEALEADVTAPSAEVRARIIKRIAEFDEHVEGHQESLHILAAGIINQRFDGDECAAWRQRVVG